MFDQVKEQWDVYSTLVQAWLLEVYAQFQSLPEHAQLAVCALAMLTLLVILWTFRLLGWLFSGKRHKGQKWEHKVHELESQTLSIPKEWWHPNREEGLPLRDVVQLFKEQTARIDTLHLSFMTTIQEIYSLRHQAYGNHTDRVVKMTAAHVETLTDINEKLRERDDVEKERMTKFALSLHEGLLEHLKEQDEVRGKQEYDRFVEVKEIVKAAMQGADDLVISAMNGVESALDAGTHAPGEPDDNEPDDDDEDD